MEPTKKVLFVCLGNICRSPAAEGVLKKILRERGIDGRVEVDSAGTGPWHVGESPDPRMQEAASRRGYVLESVGRQVRAEDFDRFDWIIAMDRENLADLRYLAPDEESVSKVCLLSDFLPDGNPVDVPDPYYGGPDGFDRVLDILEEASERIADRLTS